MQPLGLGVDDSSQLLAELGPVTTHLGGLARRRERRRECELLITARAARAEGADRDVVVLVGT